MSDNDPLYPKHSSPEFIGEPVLGWQYRATNVHKCDSCGHHLLKRDSSWPLNIWECDSCHSKKEIPTP